MTDTKMAPAGVPSPRGARAQAQQHAHHKAADSRPQADPADSRSQDRVLAWIERSDRTRLRVALATFKGRVGIDVRLFEIYRTTGELGPTSRGIRLRPNEIAQLIDALEAARAITGSGQDTGR